MNPAMFKRHTNVKGQTKWQPWFLFFAYTVVVIHSVEPIE